MSETQETGSPAPAKTGDGLKWSPTAMHLMTVAQTMFAEKGVDAVSLNMIIDQSGHGNRSAAQYYFGSKEGLLMAIIATRMQALGAARLDLVEHLESSSATLTVDEVLKVWVGPLATWIENNSELTYLRFLSRLLDHPSRLLSRTREESPWPLRSDGYNWVLDRLRELLPGLAQHTFDRRWGWSVGFTIQALANYERLRATNPESAPSASLVTKELSEMLTVFMSAGVDP